MKSSTVLFLFELEHCINHMYLHVSNYARKRTAQVKNLSNL